MALFKKAEKQKKQHQQEERLTKAKA